MDEDWLKRHDLTERSERGWDPRHPRQVHRWNDHRLGRPGTGAGCR
jgi:hypothetical protein